MKYLITFFLLFGVAYGQSWVPMASNYKYRGLKADSILGIPRFSDTVAPAKANGYIILVDSTIYFYNNKWQKVEGSVFDSTSLSNRINDKIDSLKRIESFIYFKKNGEWLYAFTDSVVYTDTSSLSSRINSKLSISDTSSMLSNYAKINLVNTKLNISDTANMLSKYLRKVDTASLSSRINDKVDSIKRIFTNVYFYKNGIQYFGFTDSIGGGGFVPYTGATQDVDLGNNGLDAKFVKITGTAGNGHIDLKHQSGDATGQANSTKLYANSSGYLKWKNDNQYYSTLAMPQTADRIYTFENKSYTLGDSADIAARVKYTDTASMLSPYLRSNTASATYLAKSDSVTYQTKYRTDTMRTNIYNGINGKQTQLNGTGFLKASGTTITYDNSTYLSSDYYDAAMSAMGSTTKGFPLGARYPGHVNNNQNLNGGNVYFVAYYLPTAQTITGVRWWQGGTSTANAGNYSGFGLYSVTGGTLTLVASTTNDTTLFKNNANTLKTKAFSSTYSASAGLYYVGVLFTQTGAVSNPNIGCGLNMVNGAISVFDYTNSNRMVGILSSATALPSSQALSGLTNSSFNYALFLY